MVAWVSQHGLILSAKILNHDYLVLLDPSSLQKRKNDVAKQSIIDIIEGLGAKHAK